MADGYGRPYSERNSVVLFASAKEDAPGRAADQIERCPSGRTAGQAAAASAAVAKSHSRNTFPRILDEYVIREFLGMFLLVQTGFVLLILVFTFFELVGDILRNHPPLAIVGAYLVNLTPSMVYQIAPLAVLIAVLVTFGVLN